MTGITAEKMYSCLEWEHVLPSEQNGAIKRAAEQRPGINLWHCKRRSTNLTMT